MTMLPLWLTLGIVAGVLHALGLWSAARHWRDSGWSAVWRLPAVAGVLVAAGLMGGVLSTAAGWACGFAGASLLVAVGRAR